MCLHCEIVMDQSISVTIRGVGRIFEKRGQMKYEYIIANGGAGGGLWCIDQLAYTNKCLHVWF